MSTVRATGTQHVTDPVCGMQIDPAKTEYRTEHEGVAYYFCSARCADAFAKDPSRYAVPDKVSSGHSHAPEAAADKERVPAGKGAYVCPMCADFASDKPGACPKCGMALELAIPPPAAHTEYTCPMHPEIVRDAPGTCPICGMALEPRTVSAEEAPNPELADMTRRFRLGLALTVPLLFITMGELVPAIADLVHGAWNPWVQLALATPVVLWAGWPFFERGWNSIIARNLNMFTLIAIGTGTAFLYSTIAVVAPGIFPVGFRDDAGRVGLYFEAAAVITVLVLLGQVLELRARERTSGALRALLDLTPKTARRVRDDREDEEIPLDRVQIGDRLRVRPGDSIPVDGVVLEGHSAVDVYYFCSRECREIFEAAPDLYVGGGDVNQLKSEQSHV